MSPHMCSHFYMLPVSYSHFHSLHIQHFLLMFIPNLFLTFGTISSIIYRVTTKQKRIYRDEFPLDSVQRQFYRWKTHQKYILSFGNSCVSWRQTVSTKQTQFCRIFLFYFHVFSPDRRRMRRYWKKKWV